MAEFAAEVRRLMGERGLSLRGLAKAASYDPSYLSKVLSGHKPSSPYLAARLDDALGAGGTVRDAIQQPPPRRETCRAAYTRSSLPKRPTLTALVLESRPAVLQRAWLSPQPSGSRFHEPRRSHSPSITGRPRR
jgi:transcriptional regulator with XRE-family HTH domain